jgi:hypothetical protein
MAAPELQLTDVVSDVQATIPADAKLEPSNRTGIAPFDTVNG